MFALIMHPFLSLKNLITFNVFHLCVMLCLQGPVFSVPSGPRDLCCCSAGFVTLHQEPRENPPRARGDETCSGISAKSGVGILVSCVFFLQYKQMQGWSVRDYVPKMKPLSVARSLQSLKEEDQV